MAHVVYLMASALSERDTDRFGMAAMRARGIKVSVLDLADICHPTIRQQRDQYSSLGSLRPCVVSSREELTACAPLLAEADVIFCLLTTGIVTRPIYPILRLVARSGTPWGLICSNTIPGIRNYKGEVETIHRRVADIVARRKSIDPLSSLLSRLPIGMIGLRPADFVVLGGEESRRDQPLFGPATMPILAHAYDYETVLSESRDPTPQADIAVFLDQFLPHHRDWALLGVESVVDTETYYPHLRLLFDRIEAELGLEVVIAAHPRADYADKPGVFGDRRIVYGKSDQLIRQCRIAMTFTSLAINFAVLHRKQILLLTTERYYRSPAGHRYTDPISRELGLPIIYLENAATAPLAGALHVDGALYDRYVARYVKMPGSAERPYWEIVLEALSERLAPFRSAEPAAA